MIMIVMIKMINDYDNANDDKGGQTRTLFQIMHFREPLISEKSIFFGTYSCVGV